MMVQKNIINLYVYDLRDCPDGFILARTFEEAIFYLENNIVDLLSLDHDMGEDCQGY
ncbi:cyclic-phosphate processing receiver domain-containing protein [Clostridium sp. C8-1-8]|uniref:cyclic-phosphate processing receiver domain-containing protein n=1 Tax=Clostridium sp. C8-1-8 TaxID=2698831 RepID=UPI0019250EE0|nr:cyclic-phosphate processing receiver domain-containing protein [Clostridium sp. C8-1-8]